MVDYNGDSRWIVCPRLWSFPAPIVAADWAALQQCCFGLLVIIVDKQLISHVDRLCRHENQMWLFVNFHRYDFQLIDKTTPTGLASCIIM